MEFDYREAIGEEYGAAGVGESHEELLLGQHIGGELPVGERGQVERQEAGPDDVGVGRGAEGRRDRGCAAGVPRRGPGERR